MTGLQPIGIFIAKTADVSGSYTAAALTGLALTIGGVACSTPGIRVLMTNQTDPAENGLYIVNSGAWETTYPNEAKPIVVTVAEGDNRGNWYCSTTDWSAGPNTWEKQKANYIQSVFTSLAADTNTTSTTFVDLLSLTLNIKSGSKLKSQFTASANSSAAATINFRFVVDGVVKEAVASDMTANGTQSFTLTNLTTGLSAGNRTVKIQWKVSAGTASIRPLANPDSESSTLTITELGV